VTVDYDNNSQPIGYISARRNPSQEGIVAITPIYQEMLCIEQQAGARDAPDASLKWFRELLREKGTIYEEFIHTLGH
jgi:hypothetical protein